jgi:acetyl-CoA carboxylase carboxyl transferase subunit alpha
MDGYEIVKISRSSARYTSVDFIDNIFSDFREMHGDRRFGDDRAVISGIAMLGPVAVTVIGLEKGHGTKDKISRNFGSASPEGYRKALRQMKLAEKFKRPIVCFVDTAGAYCGIEAERRGQGQAIAENLAEMMTLRVPIISIIIGEGGSGGALALSVSDEIWMLENAYYSVVSPEGCASILWKDPAKAPEAAACLKLTADDLLELGIIERKIRETEDNLFQNFKKALTDAITLKTKTDTDILLNNRYNKFRKI